MSAVFRCDRCSEIMDTVALTVSGRDLCTRCTAELRVWLSAPVTRFQPSKHGNGKQRRNRAEVSLETCKLVADASGRLSASAFAEATQEDFRASYQRLRHLHRKGLLERVSGSVYQLKSQSQEAAE